MLGLDSALDSPISSSAFSVLRSRLNLALGTPHPGKHIRQNDVYWCVRYGEFLCIQPAFWAAIITALRGRIENPHVLYSKLLII